MKREAAARALLGREWGVIEADFDAYVRAAEAAVARSEWLAFSPDLVEFPRTHAGDEKPGRAIAPTSPGDKVCVGYDTAGIVRVARYHGPAVSSIVAAWSGDVLLRWCPTGVRLALLSLSHLQRDADGRPRELRTWFDGWRARRKTYVWRGDSLQRTAEEEYDEDLGAPAALREQLQSEYEYDAQGLLRVRWKATYHRPDAESWTDGGVSWCRRSPQALKAARAVVARELPRRVAAWAARVAPQEPVYALALQFSVDDPALPPALGLGTVAELTAWKAQHGPNLRDDAWNPAEYRIFEPTPPELTDSVELLDAFALLNQDWALSENDREPAATLRRCARRLLADLAWAATLELADGFAVVALPDEHDDDFSRHLAATVPAATLRSIEARE